jgi:hypothetical protein
VNELKAVVKQVVTVQLNDLEKFVEATYGVPWSFHDPAMGLYETDTFVVYQVDGSTDESAQEYFDRWLRRKAWVHPFPLMVLNDLARNGLIIKGEYLIEDRRSESGQ